MVAGQYGGLKGKTGKEFGRKMKNSVIIGFIAAVWNRFLGIYNDCFLEKIIKSICDYFKHKSTGSVICTFFRNKALDGSYWRESTLFRIVTSPIRLLMFAADKAGDKLISVRENSEFLKIFDNLLYIPLREYGIMAASFTAAAAITSGITSNVSPARIIVLGAMLIISIILMLIPYSIHAIAGGSLAAKAAKSLFNSYNIEKRDENKIFNIKYLKVLSVLAFAAGAAGGILSPIITAAAVLAAAAMVFILHNTLAGVFICVLAAPILPTMVCAGLIALTIISFAFKLLCEKDRKYVITPMSFLVVGFLLLAAFSSLTSFNIPKSVQILVLYILFAFMYFLIVNNIKTKNQWYNLLIVFVLAGMVVGLIGIYQNYFLDSTVQSWVDEEMFENIQTRVYSTLDNPNVLGQYLVLAAPVAFAALWSVKGAWNKIVMFIAFAVMCVCLIFTWSRAAWVGIILAVGFYLIIKDRRWATLCIVGLLIMPFVLPESILSRITSIGNFKDSSTAYRVSVWIASLRMAKDFWISGIGLGSGAFERVYQNYALNGAGFALHSHNFYIQLVVEMGILGLILFLLIILSTYKQIISIKERNTINKNVTIAMGGALIGYLFQGVAENLWYNYRMVLIFWIYLGILQSGVNITNKNAVSLDSIK